VRIRVAAGGVLTWHGEPFVVADGSRPHRRTTVELAAGAVACLRETLILGRTGEHGGELTSSTSVTLGGRPLLAEDLDLRREPRSLPGIVTSKVIDSVLLLGRRPLDTHPVGMRLYELAGCGAVARHLGDELHRSGGENCFATWRDGPDPAGSVPIRPH
jgi:urease accessory protein